MKARVVVEVRVGDVPGREGEAGAWNRLDVPQAPLTIRFSENSEVFPARRRRTC